MADEVTAERIAAQERNAFDAVMIEGAYDEDEKKRAAVPELTRRCIDFASDTTT